MADKFSGALKALCSALSMTQPAFAKKLRIGAPSVAHYETGDRRSDAPTSARSARTACDADRIDLAEIFAAALAPRFVLTKKKNPTSASDIIGNRCR
jgi:transcriptional regulator with XRE-family HTH domain